MSKLDKIKKTYEDAQATRASLEADLTALKARRIDEQAKADDRAAHGDTDGYRAALERLTDIDVDIHVKTKMLEHIAAPVSKADAVAAWNEYAAKEGKRYKDALRAYYNARKEAQNKIYELLSVLHDMFATRQNCARYAAGTDNELQDYELDTVSARVLQEDLRFFCDKLSAETDPQNKMRHIAEINIMLNTQRVQDN